MKKGKQEQYVKDDDALEQLLTQLALDGAALHSNEGAPAIKGEALESLFKEYQMVAKKINLLSRRIPNTVLNALLNMPTVNKKILSEQVALEAWTKDLLKIVANTSNDRYTFHLVHDEEENSYYPVLEVMEHGVTTDYPLSTRFFMSGEYDIMASFTEKLFGLIEETAVVKRGEKQQAITQFSQAVDWLIEQAKHGFSIQRYKGLGEMNPEQLWETTMDPDTRRMLKVTIEDAIAADEIFTTLMGDHVEPRREFIEKNALNATNIDV